MSEKKKNSGNATAHKPAWIFSWRRSFRLRWNLLLAAAIVLAIMALLLSTVRVRVFTMPPTLNRSAELVLVPASPDNLGWMEHIAQKTPFPDGGRDRSIEALSAEWLRTELSTGFVPSQNLRAVNLPMTKPVFEENALLPPLPTAEVVVPPVADATNRILRPRVRWLSPVTENQLPQSLPDYLGPADAVMGMKYLLEVNREGNVVTCVPAAKEVDKRNVALENWLKRLRFGESKQGLGWLACEIIWQYDHD
jgi:hypothetical protein